MMFLSGTIKNFLIPQVFAILTRKDNGGVMKRMFEEVVLLELSCNKIQKEKPRKCEISRFLIPFII